MKAIVQTAYGRPEDVLKLRDVARPEVGDDEVLVAVRATSVHADVWHVVTGRPRVLRLMGAGLRAPSVPVPGTDLAGVVEAVGASVTRFRPGDRVFGESQRQMQWRNGGAYAQYAAVPADTLVKMPASVSFEQAASVPTAGYIALINLPPEPECPPGMNALINGAAGAVGSIALQALKARGARVTGVDCAARLPLLKTLGADHVIDYEREDFTRGHERFDLIYDVASTLSLSDCKRVLTPSGTYVLIGHDHYGSVGSDTFGNLPSFFVHVARALFDRHLPGPSFSIPEKGGVMTRLLALLETGALTPVIDRAFGLAEAAQALRYLQQGSGVGRIIITPWA